MRQLCLGAAGSMIGQRNALSQATEGRPGREPSAWLGGVAVWLEVDPCGGGGGRAAGRGSRPSASQTTFRCPEHGQSTRTETHTL